MKHIILLFSVVLVTSILSSQTVLISEGGTYTVECGGTDISFLDSGGDDGYEAGEAYTITFCPDGGNAVIFLIDTETAGDIFDVATGDALTVFDGPDTDSPVLDVVTNLTFSGSPVLNINATLDNTSGCLTFLFESTEDSPTGQGWTSAINCGQFWQPFDIEVTTEPSEVHGADHYIDICQGETVNFTANGIFPSAGGSGYEQTNENSYFHWEMGDGTEFEGFGLTEVSNTYSDEFGYPIILNVTDTLGQTRRWEGGVRVSTTPDFSQMIAEYRDTICLGTSTTLYGGITQDTTNTFGVQAIPSAFIGGGFLAGQTFLPDGSGTSYSTSILIDDFPLGATIQNPDDVVAICATMEHSYLGDLDITLTCPDGTTIILQEQEGGSCNLGVPWATSGVDGDSGNITPGEGYQYCWTADAPNGTLASGCVNGIEFLVGDGPDTYTDSQVAEGDYTPVDPISDLIGCPINGEWTITVTDNIGADNGYIFSWGVQFNPLIDPTVVTYQPLLIDGYWEDEPTIVFNNDTIIEVQPLDTGSYFYTFHVEDDFGCAYDTTVQLVVIPHYSTSILGDEACNFSTVLTVEDTHEGGVWSWESAVEDIEFVSFSDGGAVMDPGGETTATNSSYHEGVVDFSYFDNFCQTTQEVSTFFRPFPIAAIEYNEDTLAVLEVNDNPGIPIMFEYDTLFLCTGDETVLDALSQPTAITDASYTWALGNTPISNETQLPINVDELITAAMGGGEVELTLSVQDDECPPNLYPTLISIGTVPIVPEGCFPYTVFSPNGDGSNDFFYIGGVTRLRNTMLHVYNRWGNLVYERRNYQNDWAMEDLTDGTYFFTLTSQSKGGEFNGSFTVVGSGN